MSEAEIKQRQKRRDIKRQEDFYLECYRVLMCLGVEPKKAANKAAEYYKAGLRMMREVIS